MKPYRPSNGSEGDSFQAAFCERCVHDKAARAGRYEDGCLILARALFLRREDPNYPKEWVVDDDGRSNPRCLAFREEGGDGDRPAPPDPDPRQLVLITDPSEDIALVVAPAPPEYVHSGF